jgi:hypothetical protein
MPLEFPYRASQPKLRGARFDQNNTLPVKSPRPKLSSDSEGSCIFKVSQQFPGPFSGGPGKSEESEKEGRSVEKLVPAAVARNLRACFFM